MINNIHEGRFAMAAQAIGRVLVEETFENGGSFDAQRTRYAYSLLQNYLEQIILSILQLMNKVLDICWRWVSL